MTFYCEWIVRWLSYLRRSFHGGSNLIVACSKVELWISAFDDSLALDLGGSSPQSAQAKRGLQEGDPQRYSDRGDNALALGF